jgi:cellulose synthase/poly-beta-1,6-N-acetylglucosamine synthase-like glycosyltransferase
MPKVTVLTAVKDGAQYLAETIDSIRNQTFEDWEYILVDDQSSDATVEIIKGYQAQDERIKLIQLDKNLGPYGAANVGLKAALGEYVVRTDGDDISLPNRIEKQLDFLAANPHLRACASYAQRIDKDSNVLEDNKVISSLTAGSMKWYLFLRCPLVHSTACVERNVFEEMGGYDTTFTSQDYKMWSYLVRQNYVAQIPEILVYFRLTPSGISLSRQNVQQSNGLKVAQDHIREVTGETWSLDRIKALNALGLVKKGSPVFQTMKASRLWDEYWLADDTLSDEEMSELASLSRYLRKSFLRRNRRHQFLQVIMNARNYVFPKPRSGKHIPDPNIPPY